MEIKQQEGSDPDRWGHSLQNAWPILKDCLDAVGAKSVVEVGAFAGDLTADILDWAVGAGATVTAIDPTPAPELHELAAKRPELDVIGEPSLEGLKHVTMPDAFVIDGDHNYYTVIEELRTIAGRVEGEVLPLIILHDVSWPHARRDTYYAPERIPEEARQPMVEGGGLFPGVEGLVPGSLPYKWAAATEGGPGNGVLTAIEDFVETDPGLNLAIIPVFFGVGVVWHDEAPWAAALQEAVAPFDRHLTLLRMESNRVFQLARSQVLRTEIWKGEKRIAAQEALLRSLLESKAFEVADRVSHARNRGQLDSWREQIRKVLEVESDEGPFIDPSANDV